jgi:hypothetical protein
MAQTNVQAFSGDVEISGETVLGTATYRKKIRWDRNELAYVYLGNIRTNNTTGIRLDVSLNNSDSGYEMYQFQITLNGNDDSHAGGKMLYSAQGGTVSVLKEVDIGYVYVGSGGSYEYQLWLKDPTTDTTGQMDVYLNCQGYYNFDTGVSDVAQGGSAPTNFNLGTPGVVVDKFGKVGIGTTEPDKKLHIYTTAGEGNTQLYLESESRYSTIQMLDDTGAILFGNDRGDFRFITGHDTSISGGSEAMRITGNGNVGIGTNDPTATLDIYKEDTTAAGQTVISSITGVFSGSDATGGNVNNKGLFINLDSSATGGTLTVGEEHRLWGIDVDIDVTGDSDDIKGGRFLVRSELAENGEDRNSTIYGIDAQAHHDGSAPSTNIIGVFGRSLKASSSTGLTTRMIGVDTEYEINAGTCTDAYGVRARFDRNGGAVSNSYIFYGDHIGSTTTITNNYGLYVTDVDKHYLEGNVGIGTTDPECLLHLSASTAITNITDPIKLKIHNRTEGGGWSSTQPWGLIEFDTNDGSNFGNGPVAGIGCRFESSAGGSASLCFYTDDDVGDDSVLGPANERMCIDSAGNVGIGKTEPGTALDVVGDILASGNITAYSDRRLKSDIERIEGALDKVCALGGYTFTMNDKRSTGLIAQEVKEVLPEAVHGSEETHYSLAYGNVIGLIVEAIKELKEKVG